MLRRKKVALLLVLVILVLSMPTECFGLPDRLPITEAMAKELNSLKASGKMSNDYLDHTIIDLVYISSGSVTSYTYVGDNEDLTINTFNVTPIDNFAASDKITRYVFNLTNQYRPDTEISISVSLPDCESVSVHTYGALKHEAMLAIISGIPDCLANPRLGDTSGSGSKSGSKVTTTEQDWTEKYSPERMVFTTFKIGEKTYTATDGTIKTMDAEPILQNNRTFVPVRSLAYALGATEDDVSWDSQTQTVTLEFENATEVLQLGSQTMLVNDEPMEMDVAPFAENGRTFLPARWIAEPLGAQVDWNEEMQEITITTD